MNVILLLSLLLSMPSHAARNARPKLDAAELNARGFTLVPAEALFSDELMDEVARNLTLPETLALARHSYSATSGPKDHIWDMLGPLHQEAEIRLLGKAVEMSDRLTDFLRTGLPEETLEPLQAEARAALGTGASGAFGHADTGYLTATMSLEGAGSKLYVPNEHGEFSTIHVPPRTLAVMSNRDRAAALEVPVGLHSAPFGVMKARSLLLERFGDAYGGPPAGLVERMERVVGEQERRLNEFLRRLYPDFFPR